MKDAIVRGIQLFNEHRFFEAHEALEEAWLKERGEAKTLLHGLIQIAAAFHHYSRANLGGFNSLLKKGSAKLDQCGHAAAEIDLTVLKRQLALWREFGAAHEHDRNIQPPSIPQITLARRRFRA